MLISKYKFILSFKKAINFSIDKDTKEYASTLPNGEKYYIKEVKNVSIPAGESSKIEIEIPVSALETFQPNEMDLHYSIDGEKYERVVFVNFERLDDDE